MKPKWFFCEVFQRNIYFFHNWKLADYKRWIEKTYKVELDFSGMKNTNGELREFTDGEKSHLFVFTKKTPKLNRLDTLVHECNHLANYIFKQHGVKPDLNNDEFESYYKAMLFRKALQK